MSDHIIVLPRKDTSALMAAIADLEDAVLNFDQLVSQGSARELVDGPVSTLSRIAADIDAQVQGQ